MSEGSGKNGGWPWFNGTCKDYPAFWRKWSSYEKRHHQLTPQTELVRLFREKCMSKEIARYSGIGGTMVEAWAKLDRIFRNDQLFCAELRQEIQACPRIKEHEYERQLDHYVLIQNSIDEADKENLGDLFLDLDGIEEITQAFSSREKSLWRGIREHMQPWEHGTTFTAFVNDRLQWTTDRVHEIRYRQLRRTLPMPTPLPIDAARSGSVGGKHSRGKGTRRNAYTVPVQGGNKVEKSARASCYPARIRGSNRASDPAQKHGLASKPAQERSQETLSRKRSPEQDAAAKSEGGYEYPQGCDPAGPHADRRSKAPEIPGLRSQEEQYATGAARIVGIGISGNDGDSSLAQVTSATTAPKDGTRRGTNSSNTPALVPKRKKKSGVNKRRASPSPEQGEALQVNDEPNETPRQAYKKPARQQEPARQQAPARQQVPSQQPRPAMLQAPMGKRGRMERAQRQAAGRAATPFQTTRPPDGQRRDGLTY
jgi:hypothetical protein